MLCVCQQRLCACVRGTGVCQCAHVCTFLVVCILVPVRKSIDVDNLHLLADCAFSRLSTTCKQFMLLDSLFCRFFGRLFTESGEGQIS